MDHSCAGGDPRRCATPPPPPRSAQVHGLTPTVALGMQQEVTRPRGPLECLPSPLTVAPRLPPFLHFKTILQFVHSRK